MLHKNKITGAGYNTVYPVGCHTKRHRSIHAEHAALLKASEGDTVIVVRILKDGTMTCSKPCDNCMKQIRKAGIERVYYIDWEGELQRMSVQ